MDKVLLIICIGGFVFGTFIPIMAYFGYHGLNEKVVDWSARVGLILYLIAVIALGWWYLLTQ